MNKPMNFLKKFHKSFIRSLLAFAFLTAATPFGLPAGVAQEADTTAYNAEDWARKADADLVAGNLESSEAACLRAIEKAPQYAWPMITLAKGYLLRGRLEEALQRILTALSYEKDPAALQDAYLVEASILHQMKDYEGAERVYQKSQTLGEPQAAFYEQRSWNLRLLNRVKDSEELLLEGLGKFPESSRLHLSLAALYKDRRYYPQCLEYLESAFSQTDIKTATEGPGAIYRKEFFRETGIRGYSLEAQGLPVEWSASYTYNSEFSNSENILRAIQNLNLTEADPSLLPPVHATRRHQLRWSANTRFGSLPLTHFYAALDDKTSEKDRSIEHQILDLRIEPEWTAHDRVFGDVTFFPYFQYARTEGANISAQDILSDQSFEIDVHTLGLRVLLQPALGKFYLTGEYAFGFGDFKRSSRNFTEHRGIISGGWAVDEVSRLEARAEVYYSPQNTDSSSTRFRQFTFYEREVAKNLKISVENEVVHDIDAVQGAEDIETTFYRPGVSATFPLLSRGQIKAFGAYFLAESLHLYDHWDLGAELSFKQPLALTRKVGKHVLETEEVLDFFVGYHWRSYNRLPETKENKVQSVDTGVRLFY